MRAAMQHVQHVRSWAAFLKRIEKLRGTGRDLLFRGQSDSRWKLQTTLERLGQENMLVADYFNVAGRIQPAIESVTDRTFEMPPYPELLRRLGEYDAFSLDLTFGRFPGLRYLTYARHTGLPSPLLDWSESPYVAAFFAFASPNPRKRRRSIYMWVAPKFTASGTDRPEFKRIGPYLATHPRHVAQKCQYTVCATFTTSDKQWRFTPQQNALAEDDLQQIWKFTIPSSERLRVLEFLDEFNLHAFSLFGTEDSLMEAMAIREFELRPRIEKMRSEVRTADRPPGNAEGSPSREPATRRGKSR